MLPLMSCGPACGSDVPRALFSSCCDPLNNVYLLQVLTATALLELRLPPGKPVRPLQTPKQALQVQQKGNREAPTRPGP